MARVERARVVVCGAGSVGGHVVEGLVRVGARGVSVVDFDRVEEHNLSSQPYGRRDIGQLKAKTLANRMYRELGVEVVAVCERLVEANAAKVFAGADVVVDAFDTTESRALVQRFASEVGAACVHVGLGDGYAEVVWDPGYRVPQETGEDECERPMARNLAVIAAAAGCERVLAYLDEGVASGWAFTLRDLRSD